MNSFDCDACNKQYKSYQSLWYHKKHTHKIENIVPDKKYKCENCNITFTRNSSLSRHLLKCRLNVKPNEIKENQCDKCFYVFKSKNGYKGHKCKVKKIHNDNSNNNNSGIINNINGNNNVVNIFNIDQVSAFSLSYDNIEEIIKGGNLLELLYFNKDLPQNHVMCKDEYKSPHINLMNYGKTIKKNIKNFYDIVKGNLKKHYDEIILKLKPDIANDQLEETQRKFEKEKEKLDEQEKKFIEIMDELLYNERMMVKDSWKKGNVKNAEVKDIEYGKFWTRSYEALKKEAYKMASEKLKGKNYVEDKYMRKLDKYAYKYIQELIKKEKDAGMHEYWENESKKIDSE